MWNEKEKKKSTSGKLNKVDMQKVTEVFHLLANYFERQEVIH